MTRLGIGFTVVLTVVIFIAAPKSAFATSCGKSSSHNGIFGQRQPGDEVLYSNLVKVSSKFMRVVTLDIDYPGKNDKPGIITYIEIYDQYTDNSGGCASIFNGGVGSDHVGIHLKSQRNKGMEFSVKIYGRQNRHW